MKTPKFMSRFKMKLEDESKKFVENVSPTIQKETKKVVNAATSDICNRFMAVGAMILTGLVVVLSTRTPKSKATRIYNNYYYEVNTYNYYSKEAI